MGKSKFFCLGLSSTGKHSLMTACQILGYTTTTHYPHNYNEIDASDVACDAFVVVHYKELDRKYPGSKFIYTKRDLDPWADSVVRHLMRYPAESKSEFKREYRRKVWGSESPTRQQIIQARKKLEKDIAKYFKDRKDDILYMNIPNGDHWEVLCPFLGKPIPSRPFPHIDTSV